jgi:hypothetical protein
MTQQTTNNNNNNKGLYIAGAFFACGAAAGATIRGLGKTSAWPFGTNWIQTEQEETVAAGLDEAAVSPSDSDQEAESFAFDGGDDISSVPDDGSVESFFEGTSAQIKTSIFSKKIFSLYRILALIYAVALRSDNTQSKPTRMLYRRQVSDQLAEFWNAETIKILKRQIYILQSHAMIQEKLTKQINAILSSFGKASGLVFHDNDSTGTTPIIESGLSIYRDLSKERTSDASIMQALLFARQIIKD